MSGRPSVQARFLGVGGRKRYIRGVTYGTFSEGADGSPYPEPDVVRNDFAAMAASGANAIRPQPATATATRGIHE